MLGYDVLDSNITAKIWPILSNARAVQINQQWAGHPGRLIKAWDVHPPPPPPPGTGYVVTGSCDAGAAKGWSFDGTRGQIKRGGKCMDSAVDVAELQLVDCDPHSPTQKFTRTPVALDGTGPYDYHEYVQPRNGHNSGGCVDIYCAQSPCGPNVQVMYCHAGSNQIFAINASSDASTMKSKSGQCLAYSVDDPSTHGGGEWFA